MQPSSSSDLRPLSPGLREQTAAESIDGRLCRLAAHQHGLFGRAQSLAAGADDRLLYRRVAAGRLERMAPGVYRLPGYPSSFRQLLMAAILGAGSEAVASHRAAAALLGLDGVAGGVIELSVPPTRRYKGALTHRTGDLAPFDVTRVDGVPCTTATRTCLDLGAVASDDVVERAFECAVRRGLTTESYAARRARALARQGREGPAALLRVVTRRQQPANGSDLETLFEQLCRESGVSGLRRQLRIGRYVADFADPVRRVVVELDGLATHSTSSALQADLRRQNHLVLDGWKVLRFTWEDVTRRQASVVAALGRC